MDCLHWLATFLAGAPKRERKTQVEAKHSEGAPVAAVAPSVSAAVVAEAAAETAATEKEIQKDTDQPIDDDRGPPALLPTAVPA
jgi:hypothetical protein